MHYVLDTFAVMAYLRSKKSFDILRSIILETLAGKCGTYISVINLGELFFRQSGESGAIKAESSLSFGGRAGIIIGPAASDRVLRTARLKATISMSYADAFAATPAKELNPDYASGNHIWKS